MSQRLTPPIRADRAPSRFDAGIPAQTGDQLAIGQSRGCLAGNVPKPTVAKIVLGHVPRQAFVDRPGAEDQQVVSHVQPIRDVPDESVQVFDPVRLAGGLWATAAAMTNGGIVAHMAGGPAMGRHSGFHPFYMRPAGPHPDDDGLPRVDPDKRAGAMVGFRSHRGLGTHPS